jgi:hypothetical protein
LNTRVVRVGSMKNGTYQIITTRYEDDDASPNGTRECITLETPVPITDTARLRLLKTWELERSWPS